MKGRTVTAFFVAIASLTTMAATVVSCSLGFDSKEFYGGGQTDGVVDGRAPFDGATLAAQDGQSVSIDGSAPSSDATAAPPPSFSDDFNRADGPTIGNGWSEEDPSAFLIVSNQVKFVTPDNDQEVVKVLRPTTDLIQDVRASVEVTMPSAKHGEPSLIVRAAPPIGEGNPGYLLSVYALDEAALVRFYGPDDFDISFPLSPPITPGDPVRLVLVARQTNGREGPVQLDGSIVRVSDGVVLGSKSHLDMANGRHWKEGIVGFTDDSCCGKAPGELFDNFSYGPP